jgi:hypothetical protein
MNRSNLTREEYFAPYYRDAALNARIDAVVAKAVWMRLANEVREPQLKAEYARARAGGMKEHEAFTRVMCNVHRVPPGELRRIDEAAAAFDSIFVEIDKRYCDDRNQEER